MKTLLRSACLAALSAATLSAVAGPTSVPFSANLATQEQIVPDQPQCPSFAGSTSGSGHATHLGHVTGTARDCLTPAAGSSYTFTNGKLTLIAANGDELRADYYGTLKPTAVQPIFAIDGTFRITGGTGRFSTASGWGQLGGTENIQTLQGQFLLNGTISY